MRILLLVNTTASTVTARKRVLVQKALALHHELEVAQTTRRGHASKLARSAANDGFDACVVLAGDGTLNEAADGLVGTNCALGAIPGGSTNVYAQTLGTSSNVVVAAEAISKSLEKGSVKRIGVGNAAGRRFLFHCGIGFDAAVIRRVERHGELKRFAPHPLYVGAAFDTWLRHFDRNRPHFDITIPNSGEVIEGVYFAIISKTSPYTYLGHRPIHVAPNASIISPLALTAFTRIDALTLLGSVGSAMGSRKFLNSCEGIVHRHAIEHLQVNGRRDFAWQVDGDDLGDTRDLTVVHEPGCLNLIVP